MVTLNQTLDMTPLGMIFHVTKTPAETNGHSLEMEWQLLPKANGTPVHVHPTATETYQVLEGELELNINGAWTPAQQGNEIMVSAGTPHTFRNPTNDVVRVYNTHSPALQFGDYFEGLCAIVKKLSNEGTGKMTMNLNAATRLSRLMKKYNQEMVSLNPPRLIISVLNTIRENCGFTRILPTT
ncbi:MAG: cupin domain-containing protein [Ferruginibacter sp.]|nr:cupin domain-containing protein [Cytophagales bacterium]